MLHIHITNDLTASLDEAYNLHTAYTCLYENKKCNKKLFGKIVKVPFVQNIVK